MIDQKQIRWKAKKQKADYERDDRCFDRPPSLRRHPLLTADEEKTLARAIQDGGEAGKQAFERFVTCNQGLVTSIARRYGIAYELDIDDLVQEGNLGLFKAIKKYDPDQGYRFSTYATWWIRQAITRSQIDQGHTIRIPVHIHEKVARIERVTVQLQIDLGRTPTETELAEAVGMTETTLQKLRLVTRSPLSLEMKTDEEHEEFGNHLLDVDEQTERYVEERLVHEDIQRVLNKELTDREALVIQLRFGLFDGSSMTLEAVAAQLHVTRERIRQIEAKALAKLRHVPDLLSLLVG